MTIRQSFIAILLTVLLHTPTTSALILCPAVNGKKYTSDNRVYTITCSATRTGAGTAYSTLPLQLDLSACVNACTADSQCLSTQFLAGTCSFYTAAGTIATNLLGDSAAIVSIIPSSPSRSTMSTFTSGATTISMSTSSISSTISSRTAISALSTTLNSITLNASSSVFTSSPSNTSSTITPASFTSSSLTTLTWRTFNANSSSNSIIISSSTPPSQLLVSSIASATLNLISTDSTFLNMSQTPVVTSITCPDSDGSIYISRGQFYTVSCSVKYVNNDLPSGQVNTTSLDSCLDTCGRTIGCEAVSWVVPTNNEVTGVCYLKSATGTPQSDPSTWSAIPTSLLSRTSSSKPSFSAFSDISSTSATGVSKRGALSLRAITDSSSTQSASATLSPTSTGCPTSDGGEIDSGGYAYNIQCNSRRTGVNVLSTITGISYSACLDQCGANSMCGLINYTPSSSTCEVVDLSGQNTGTITSDPSSWIAMNLARAPGPTTTVSSQIATSTSTVCPTNGSDSVSDGYQYSVQCNSQLRGVRLLARTQGITYQTCLDQCSNDASCAAINYTPTNGTCELIDASDANSGTASPNSSTWTSTNVGLASGAPSQGSSIATTSTVTSCGPLVISTPATPGTVVYTYGCKTTTITFSGSSSAYQYGGTTTIYVEASPTACPPPSSTVTITDWPPQPIDWSPTSSPTQQQTVCQQPSITTTVTDWPRHVMMMPPRDNWILWENAMF